MNRVELIGYLGKDPEIHEVGNGNLLAVLRLATHRFYRSAQGETVKQTQWHTAKLWGKEQIECMRNYLITGSHILIHGELQYTSFQGRDGHFHHAVEIWVNNLVDLDR